MKKYIIFNLTLLCLVAIMLVWISTSRLDDFNRYHTAIAQESTASAANEITAFITEKKRLVNVFGADHEDTINALINNPDDDQLHEKFNKRIETYFPDYFAFTITDKTGTPFMEDFDGLVGDLCVTDLKAFAHSDKQFPRIHPHSETYHFDILSKQGDDEVILFISFASDILGNILKSAQTTGHQLMLIRPQAANLVEVTEKGARNNLDRNDYRMSAAENERIIISKAIQDTDWHIVDLHETGLFSEFTKNMIVNNLIIFLLFMITVLIMLVLINKQEKLRLKAECYRDEFLGIVSHELRTPITSIYGSLSLLAGGKAGDISDKGKKLIDIALNNSERLKLLINDLLDLQKIEAGKMEFEFKPVEVDTFLKQCIDDNQGYADSYGVSFNLGYTEPGLIASIDENRIAQVIANLLSNAAKYGADNDNIEVTVKDIGGYARISITDHGPGIPESFRNSLFDKFTQSDVADNRKPGGTGLGLSIVKSITEEHGGHVGFETQEGAGTTFYIDLPLMD